MSELATAQTDAQTTVTAAPKPAAVARPHIAARKPWVDRFPSRPFATQSVRFGSVPAKKVYNRYYPRLDSALYSISTVLRITGGEDAAASVEKIVDDRLAAVAKEFVDEQARLRVLAEENGATIKVDFTKPITLDGHISSPRSMRFLRMCLDLDALVGVIEYLWIAGVINDRRRSDALFQWQQRLAKLASNLIITASRAFASAYRQGKVTADGEIVADAAEEAAAAEETAAAEEAAVAAEAAAADGETVASDGVDAVAGEAPKRGRKKKAASSADGLAPDDHGDIAVGG